MSRTGSRLLAVVVSFASLWAVPAQATEVKYRVTSYITLNEAKPVGDVEGHVAGPWQRRGLCLYEDGQVGTYAGAGVLDMTKGKGVVKGESSCTLEDGSSATISWTASFAAQPNGLIAFADGKGEYLRGTGRFEGIKGTVTFSGRSYTPNKGETKGDVVMDTIAVYTLPRS